MAYGRGRGRLSLIFRMMKQIIPDSFKPLAMRFYYVLRGAGHLGTRYHCPVCGVHVRSFISLETILNGKFMDDIDIEGVCHTVYEYETLNIQNFLCPVCGAQDKARLYALYLSRKLAEVGRGVRIKLIHFAPEGGLPNLLKWDPRVSYRSADLLREDVDDRVDLTDMVIYADSSVDAFICSHILEHIPNDRQALSELYRFLKPGGWGIIMVPILLTIDNTYEDPSKVTEAERLKHFGLEDHVRVYAKQDFVERLTTVGFRVRQLGIEYFGKVVFKKCGLSETNVLYIVEK